MRFALVFIFILAIFGCQNVEKPEQPEDLIAEEMMVDIFTDIYLSNAAKSVNNKVLRQNGVKLDSFIYRKYRIDSLQFVRSNAYYSSDLDTYAEIFMAVEKKLTVLKEATDSTNLDPAKKFKQKQDSLKKQQLITPAESE